MREDQSDHPSQFCCPRNYQGHIFESTINHFNITLLDKKCVESTHSECVS